MNGSDFRRWTACAVCVLFLLSAAAAFPAGASANSGPTHWENPPSLSMTPLTDCPVSVEREDLSFDFTASTGKSYDAGSRTYYSPQAMVTAAYKMHNTSSQAVTVSMAFPLIASLSALAGLKGVSVEADGKRVPFGIAVGDAMPAEGFSRNYYDESGNLVKTGLPSFAQILQSISAPPAERTIVKESGEVYRMTCDRETGVQVSGTSGLYLLASGFDGYTLETGKFSATGTLTGPDSLSLLALGSGNPMITATDSDTHLSIRAIWVATDDYVGELVRQSEAYQAYPSEEFLNRVVSALESDADAFFRQGNYVYSDAERAGFFEKNRILVLTYDVEFPANGAVSVSVQYPMGGLMDAEHSQKPVYSYGYLLNPAKGWKEFHDLNLRVAPPKTEPYMVKTTVPMQEKNGVYTAQMDALPENDLVFSLYADPQEQPKASSPLFWSSPGAIACIAFIAFAILVFALLGIRSKRKIPPQPPE